ncbi:MAG TPA: NAD-dependent epimerase/dehydratase family protein, partial [Actinospica sp.]|nr:NAD-dependent epimerase/dehydratase family protein [Actinospica sp.]
MDTHHDSTQDRPPFRRAVVTGGTGFVGTHLCRALLSEHSAAEVVCVDTFLTSSPESVAFVEAGGAAALPGPDAAPRTPVPRFGTPRPGSVPAAL